MSSIGNASLILSTNSQKLTSGLKQAGSEIKNWGAGANASIKGGFSGVAGLALKFAGPIAAVATLSKGIADMGRIADINDMSQSLGTNAEWFSGLSGAFSQANGSAEDLQKSLIELGKFTKFESKGQEDAFASIGISAEEFANMNLEEKFKSVQKAMDALPEGADRTSFAIGMLGKAGMTLAPLMAQGTAEMERLQDQFTISGEGIQAIASAEGAWQNFLNTATKLWNQVLVAMSPVLEMVSNGLVVAMQMLTPVVQALGEHFSTTWGIMKDAIALVSEPIMEVINWIGELAGEYFGFGEMTGTVSEYVTEGWKLIAKGAAYTWDAIKAGVGAISYVVGVLIEGFGYIVQGFKNVLALAKQLPDSIRPEFIDGMVDSVEDFEHMVKDAGKEMKDWGTGTFETFGESAEKVDKWFEKRKKLKVEVTDKIPEIKQEITTQIKIPEALPDITKNLSDTAESIKESTYTANAGIKKGSSEAISVEAKWKTQSLTMQANDQKVMIAELKKLPKLLTDVIREISGIDLGLGAV